MAAKRKHEQILEGGDVAESIIADLVNYSGSKIDLDSLEMLAKRFHEGLKAGAEITENRERAERAKKAS